jgi:transglutaminase-like putative cysteine protease/HEAT repeat protein
MMKTVLRVPILVMLMSALWGAFPASGQTSTIYTVMLVYRATNEGDIDAQDVIAHCMLPVSNRYQHVIDLEIDPPVSAEVADVEGQRIVTVPLGPIPAGETRAVRILARVRLNKVKVPLVARDGGESLGPDRRARYLQPAPGNELARVRPVAEQAIGDPEATDLEKARSLYEYMAANCRYDIDEEQDLASAVLDGKPASCSELAYTYAALCRAVGIPARVVSAAVNRGGRTFSVDWRGHRWAEFYAEGIGWVPVDPTNRLNHPSDNFFGEQYPQYLAVIDPGERPENGPNLRWHVFMFRVLPWNAEIIGRRTAAWRPSGAWVREAKFFNEACTALRNPDASARRAAVRSWGTGKEPMAAAFLLEALFDADAEVRKLAAEGIGSSHDDVTMLVALMKRVREERDVNVLAALVDAAKAFLKLEDEEQRAEAVKELCKSRTDRALKLLDRIWEDDSREVRKAAAQMLYKFGDETGVHDAYRRLVDDEDEFVRVLAVLRWARVGSHQALEELVDLLQSDNPWDREKAVEELVERTGDDFGFNRSAGPDSPRNREAIEAFRTWVEDHPDAK